MFGQQSSCLSLEKILGYIFVVHSQVCNEFDF